MWKSFSEIRPSIVMVHSQLDETWRRRNGLRVLHDIRILHGLGFCTVIAVAETCILFPR